MTTWHVDPVVLGAYAQERLADADAWSVEVHLAECAGCRTGLVDLVAVPPVPAELLPPGRVRPGTRRRRLVLLIAAGPAARLAWLSAVAATLAIGVAFDLAVMSPQATNWLLLVAPALPVLGVAASYGPRTDPMFEIVAATPFSGLRMVLWRTLAVLVVTAPATLVAGMVSGIGMAGLWLLPCLALTVATLALGSVIGLGRSGLVVAAGWCAMVLAPAGAAHVVTPAAGPAWVALTALAALVVGCRREVFDQLLARTEIAR